MEINDFVLMFQRIMRTTIAVSTEGAVATLTRSNETYGIKTPVTIDFDSDTIAFEDYNLFYMSPAASTILDSTALTGFSEAGEPSLLQKVDIGSLDRFGNALEIRVEDVMDFPDTDTIGLIMKAHAMITWEDSPIENVVLDLSSNGGGIDDAAIFVIATFLGQASIGMMDPMTGAMCSSTYRVDANRDRQFDESDTFGDRRLFCLISSFSFSCGNLVPCMFKESGVVTLLGRTSGGGACVVQPMSSAWGTSFKSPAPIACPS